MTHVAHGSERSPLPGLMAQSGVLVGSVVAAMIYGLALPHSPWVAVAAMLVLPLGLAAPTATLVTILAITVIVPWGLQNQLKVIGGPGQRGVLFVDALLVLALLRVSWLVIRRRIRLDPPMVLGALIAAALVAEVVWGLANGADPSAAGNEARRTLLGAGTFLLAWPLLQNHSARRMLLRWLVVIGLASGAWGLAQWLFNVSYDSAGDVGIRGGLSTGQLQGGIFAYPVAVAIAWSALIAGGRKSPSTKAVLVTVLCINFLCVFLTFERTLFFATAVAYVFVLMTADSSVRRRAIGWSAVLGVLVVFGALLGDSQVRTAFERVAMLTQVGSDHSFAHRLVESRVVLEQIAAHPLAGSGFGATITWGLRDTFAISTTTFADLGYHWLAWKVGLPVAALIVALLIRAVFRRPRRSDDVQWDAFQRGCRAALLALLISATMFAVFNTLGITSVIGLLAAVCLSQTTEARICPYSGEANRISRFGPQKNPNLVTQKMEALR